MNKIHFETKPKYQFKGDKQLGKHALCGQIWIDATTDFSKITCKKCIKIYVKLADVIEKELFGEKNGNS